MCKERFWLEFHPQVQKAIERKWPIHITAEGIFKELDSTSGNLRFAPNKTEKLVDSYQSSAFVKLWRAAALPTELETVWTDDSIASFFSL